MVIKSFLLRVENIVGSVKIAQVLDIEFLKSRFKDIHTNVAFPSIIVSFKKPKATLLLFKSGKVVITGVNRVEGFSIILDKLRSKLAQANIATDPDVQIAIHNYVVRGDLKTKINLDKAAFALENAVFDPEIFPGLIYRHYSPKVSFLIFSTGKIIITGSSNMSDIIAIAKQVIRAMESCYLLAH